MVILDMYPRVIDLFDYKDHILSPMPGSTLVVIVIRQLLLLLTLLSEKNPTLSVQADLDIDLKARLNIVKRIIFNVN